MPEKSAFSFHHTFYPKPRIKLEVAVISDATREKLQVLKQNYNDIVSQHSDEIGLTHLEEMVIETNPKLPPMVTKPYPLPLKHYQFVKEEIENLLEARLIERSMSPYAAPVIVVPGKCKLGTPLAEMKRLVINYQELNKQIPWCRQPKLNQKAV